MTRHYVRVSPSPLTQVPFVSYHWQNGFTGRLFTTNSAGLYWVEITNNNGCKAIDTIVIAVDSLPKATGIIAGLSPVCQGQNGVIYSVVPFFPICRHLFLDNPCRICRYQHNEFDHPGLRCCSAFRHDPRKGAQCLWFRA